jgi:DNA-binding MarR family transcriptional regulator
MRALWDVDHALASASKRMRGRLGVTGPERLVIRIVGEIPEISPGELADVMYVDPSSLTALLKRMVRRRLILRHVSADDARKSHLRLTPEGEVLDRVRTGTVEAAIRAALDALAPRDVATTMVVLGALSRALNALAAKSQRPRATGRPRRSAVQRRTRGR